MTPALEIKNLSYCYRTNWSFRRLPVLKSLSFDVLAGEAFGFLGHNGAGKTTTIKCLLDLCTPTGGTIKIFGEDSSFRGARRLIGYLPEQPYFYDHLTVIETLSLMADLYDIPRENRRRAVSQAMERLSLESRASSAMRTLSKGQLQRVGLAQAIMGRPSLLILDEPFSGLDPIGRVEFRDLILEEKKRGTAILMSSHVLSDVEVICDRASILVNGALKGPYDLAKLPVPSGKRYLVTVRKEPDVTAVIAGFREACLEVRERGNTLQCIFADPNGAHRLMAALFEARAQILQYESSGGDLESLFVSVVSGGGS